MPFDGLMIETFRFVCSLAQLAISLIYYLQPLKRKKGPTVALVQMSGASSTDCLYRFCEVIRLGGYHLISRGGAGILGWTKIFFSI